MMGHKHIKTTRIYAEITARKVEEDMNLLDEKIGNQFELAGEKKALLTRAFYEKKTARIIYAVNNVVNPKFCETSWLFSKTLPVSDKIYRQALGYFYPKLKESKRGVLHLHPLKIKTRT